MAGKRSGIVSYPYLSLSAILIARLTMHFLFREVIAIVRIVRYSNPITALDSPCGFQEVKIPRF
jgi:hypothetical protein